MDGTRQTATVRPRVTVVLEDGDDNWGAYVPAVPVTLATGKTRGDVLRNIEEALTELFQLHHEEAMAEEVAEAASVASQS
jgi:predicted RNase H-like HicB family nuclease